MKKRLARRETSRGHLDRCGSVSKPQRHAGAREARAGKRAPVLGTGAGSVRQPEQEIDRLSVARPPALKVPEIGLVRVALDVADLLIRRGKLADERRIVAPLFREAVEILERALDEKLTRRCRTRQIPDLIMYFEQE